MRRIVLVATLTVCLLAVMQPLDIKVSGLVAGLGLGAFLLLLLTTVGGSLGRWLQQTRLEDQILSLDAHHAAVDFSPLDWLDPIEQDGQWISSWLQGQPGTKAGETRRFVWEDDFPAVEIITELER